MEWFEYLIIVGLIAYVGLIIFLSFYLKSKRKAICGGKCKSCYVDSCPLHNIDKALNNYQKSYKK